MAAGKTALELWSFHLSYLGTFLYITFL